jgi:16S rRNA (guanine527-N7)-methyltransferase
VEADADSGFGGGRERLGQGMTRLGELLVEAGLEPVSSEQDAKFSAYLELLQKWNSKLNLTAIRSPEEILRRHFVECIFCARKLPGGIHSLLDFGSGAGFPGIPIALCRPEIAVTLAESQAKKAAFLREAVRVLELAAEVYGERAEGLPVQFDAVAMRAVDKMEVAVPAAIARLKAGGRLILLVGEADPVLQAQAGLEWEEILKQPGRERSVMAVGRLKG